MKIGTTTLSSYAKHVMVAATLMPMAMAGARYVLKVQCIEVASIIYSPHVNASHCCDLEVRPHLH